MDHNGTSPGLNICQFSNPEIHGSPQAAVDPLAFPKWSGAIWLGLLIPIAAGAIGISASLLSLWGYWTTDPMQSLGMLIVPTSLALTARVWRKRGWNLCGNWFGLILVVLAEILNNVQQTSSWGLLLGPGHVNFGGEKVILYLFFSGFILLIAGVEVWREAWFPLALLLCAKPVPTFFYEHLDIPLQNVSAHVARSFAVLIGFPSSNKELLRLMFTPHFGMFIAPGCDGVRGAVTLGYLALITGYLKRVSIPRWIAYACCGVLLGYLFNLIRLCALVVYYRVAEGHPWLESAAKQADHLIGGSLFLVAAILFLWIASRKDRQRNQEDTRPTPVRRLDAQARRAFWWRAACLAGSTLVFVAAGTGAIVHYAQARRATFRLGRPTADRLDACMPSRLGNYELHLNWQEALDGQLVEEDGAYANGNSGDKVILGIWVTPALHSIHDSWMSHGEDPRMRTDRSFLTAHQQPVIFDTAFYSDGITDSFVGNVLCSPEGCIASPTRRLDLTFSARWPNLQRGSRPVSMFFLIQQSHATTISFPVEQQLEAEARNFLVGVDFAMLSARFQ
jgi:exosortase J